MKSKNENLDFIKLMENLSVSSLLGDFLSLSVSQGKRKKSTTDAKMGNTYLNIKIIVHPPKKSWWERTKEYLKMKFKTLSHAKVHS
jgi:hypothetical protein